MIWFLPNSCFCSPCQISPKLNTFPHFPQPPPWKTRNQKSARNLIETRNPHLWPTDKAPTPSSQVINGDHGFQCQIFGTDNRRGGEFTSPKIAPAPCPTGDDDDALACLVCFPGKPRGGWNLAPGYISKLNWPFPVIPEERFWFPVQHSISNHKRTCSSCLRKNSISTIRWEREKLNDHQNALKSEFFTNV